ncbi:hypothetical protein EVAR_25618_1 [Eumeta japonica]|uniref:Uncharacterized protein n=1 Tax=Eumeta variegata TaxID=151549 RepID=A0A4C1V0T3_EUMVA|nr:hypothetical protein EVAR_25618_1 [Eumeta japonica]
MTTLPTRMCTKNNHSKIATAPRLTERCVAAVSRSARASLCKYWPASNGRRGRVNFDSCRLTRRRYYARRVRSFFNVWISTVQLENLQNKLMV